MIKSFYIDNFKSLVDFSLPPEPQQLTKFTCLIGLNGAGKSTLLQAFDFVGQLMTGQTKEWLALRDWKKAELTSKLLKKQLITFRVVLELPNVGQVDWAGLFNVNLLRCTSEVVKIGGGTTVLKLSDGQLYLPERRQGSIDFAYQGSVLSQLKLHEHHHESLIALKKFMQSLKSLEMLSPHLMRQSSKSADDVGRGGEKLSAFLAQFKGEQNAHLLEKLHEFYPHVNEWDIKSLRYGWKKLLVREDYLDSSRRPLETDARHINDGMLRILTLLAQTQTEHKFLLFDEIENGINPELIGKLVSTLISIEQQVVVTTHSPMILNYLPDEVAKESVILLYRDSRGATKARRFFDLPVPSKKLSSLGPGEVFVDTYLEDVVRDLCQEGAQQ
ncbi:MAG: AAA family ATPase [Geobacter sp.]|nr:AAA family ATPase [Geobacter sp.]